MKLTIEERQALGRVLLEKRRSLNLTQEKLVAISGVPIRTIQRAERGDGISPENLGALGGAFGTDAANILVLARASKEGPPELRLSLEEITAPAELHRHLARSRGVLQIGPEGEHTFNEHIGMFILGIKEIVDEHAGKNGAVKSGKEADYVLRFCRQMGFKLFAGHYNEELEHEGKMLRKPTALIIAAPDSDQRIHKTSKGLTLDYVVDRRKQLLHRVLKGGLTTYDWMEDQLVSKSNGEDRVRAELLRIHQEIRDTPDRRR